MFAAHIDVDLIDPKISFINKVNTYRVYFYNGHERNTSCPLSIQFLQAWTTEVLPIIEILSVLFPKNIFSVTTTLHNFMLVVVAALRSLFFITETIVIQTSTKKYFVNL